MKLPTYSERHDTSLPTVTPQLRSAPAMEQAALRRVSGVMPTDYSGIAKAKAAKWGAITKAVTSIGEAYADAAYKTDMQNAKAAATELSVALNDHWYTTNVIEGKMYDAETDTYPYIELENKLKTDSEVIAERILGKYQLRHSDAKSFFNTNRMSIEGGLNKVVRKYMADKETERGRQADLNVISQAVDITELNRTVAEIRLNGNWLPEKLDSIYLEAADVLNTKGYRTAIDQMSTVDQLMDVRVAVSKDKFLSEARREEVLKFIDLQAEFIFEDHVVNQMRKEPTKSNLDALREENDVARWRERGFGTMTSMRAAKERVLTKAEAILDDARREESYAKVLEEREVKKAKLFNVSLALRDMSGWNVEDANDILNTQARLKNRSFDEWRSKGYNISEDKHVARRQVDDIISMTIGEARAQLSLKAQADQENEDTRKEASLNATARDFGTISDSTTFKDLTTFLTEKFDRKTLAELGVNSIEERRELRNKFIVEAGKEIELRKRAKAGADEKARKAWDKKRDELYGSALKDYEKTYGTVYTYGNVLAFQNKLANSSLKELGLKTEKEKADMQAYVLGRLGAKASRVEQDAAEKARVAKLEAKLKRIEQGNIVPSDRKWINELFITQVADLNLNTPEGMLEAAERAQAFKRKYSEHFPSLMSGRINAIVHGDMQDKDAIAKIALAVEAYRTIDTLKAPDGLTDFHALIESNQGGDATEIAALWQKQQSRTNPKWLSDAKALWDNDSTQDELVKKFRDIAKSKWGLDIGEKDMVGKEVLTAYLGKQFQTYYKGAEEPALHAAVDALMKTYGYAVGPDGGQSLEFKSPYAHYSHLGRPGAGNAWIDNAVREHLTTIASKSGRLYDRTQVQLVYQGDKGSTTHPEYYLVVIDEDDPHVGEFLQTSQGEPYVISFDDAVPSNEERDRRLHEVSEGARAFDSLKSVAGAYLGIYVIHDEKLPTAPMREREASFAAGVKTWNQLAERYKQHDHFLSLSEEEQQAKLMQLETQKGYFMKYLESKGFVGPNGTDD